MKCQNCDSKNDVTDFMIGEQKVILCVDCRFKLLGKGGQMVIESRRIGRPSIGVTRKVSLTMPADTWEYLDSEAAGNNSEYLRKLIHRGMFNEQGWSNNAALGYAIYGALDLGYTEDQTQDLIRAIYRAFDMKTVEEAKQKYNNSPY